MEGTKTCAVCGAIKSTSDFYKDASRKDGVARLCKACNQAKNKARYAQHGEQSRAAARAWGAANKERRAAYDRDKYQRTKAKRNAAMLAWSRANPERSAEIKKRSAERDLDWTRQRRRANEAKRRARRAAVQVLPFTHAQLDARIAYYGGACWMCKVEPYEALDHVKPLAAGGPHILANLRPACTSCNSGKNGAWPYWVGLPA